MLLCIASLWLNVHTPATFADLESAKLSAISGSTGFACVSDLVSTGPGYRETLTVGSLPTSVSYHSLDDKKNDGTGKTAGSFISLVTSQSLLASSMTGKVTDIPHGLTSLLIPEEIALTFTAGQQPAFGSTPEFKLTGITTVNEGGQTLRKATAIAHLKRGDATITQWFADDKWVLKRFTVQVDSKEYPFSCEGKVTLTPGR